MGKGVKIIVDRRAMDHTRQTWVYQVQRDGEWVDQTDEEYANRDLRTHQVWRQRLVHGVDFGDNKTGTYIVQGNMSGDGQD